MTGLVLTIGKQSVRGGSVRQAETRVGKVRCLVADDHPAVLAAVSDYLSESGIEVVGQARDGQEALEKIESMQPAVAVVDLQMPKLTGVEVARRAADVAPATGVILFTGYGERGLVVDAVDAGARGFVSKEGPLTDLLRAVETVAAGGTYVDPVLAGAFAQAGATGKLVVLTERQRDILRMLADGQSYDEIGARLFISPETVRTHVQKAMRRLDANTKTQAVATALRQSLIG
jgi:DNA-binding NarL/FixJ family response regulator